MQPRWRALIVLSIARVAMGYQFQAIGAMAIPLQHRYQVDLAYIGWLVGLYLLPGMLLALPSGLLSTRFGDKRIALCGLALMALGGLLLSIASDASALLLARLVCGAGGVALNVVITKMIADWFAGHELVLAMSIIVNTWPIGIGLALLSLGALGEHVNLALAFGSTTVFALASMLLVGALYRAPDDASRVRGLSLAALSGFEWRMLAFAGLAWMVFNVVYAMMATFLPSYLVDHGMPLAQANALTAFNTLLIIVAVPAGGLLAERSGRPMTVAVFALLASGLLLAAILSAAHKAAWVLVFGFVLGLPVGTIAAIPARFLRPETRAIGMGVYLTLYYVGMGTLPGLISSAALRLGSRAAILAIGVGLVLLTAGLMLPIARMRKPVATP